MLARVPAEDDPLVTGGVGGFYICDGSVHVYWFRVLYGVRLRARYTEDNMTCAIDWCLGNVSIPNPMMEVLMGLIEKNFEKGLDPFHGIRDHSEVKPVFNDQAFMEWIIGVGCDKTA